MINQKNACILEHDNFIYVCNFTTMTMWVICDEDETDPVTTLEIVRLDDRGHWGYRISGSDGPFTPDTDTVLVRKIEKNYEKYLNLIIVGQHGRVQTDSSSSIPRQRVRKVDGRVTR